MCIIFALHMRTRSLYLKCFLLEGLRAGSNFVSRVIIRLTEALGTRLIGYLLSELFTSTHACYPYQWAISWAMCECVNTQYM